MQFPIPFLYYLYLYSATVIHFLQGEIKRVQEESDAEDHFQSGTRLRPWSWSVSDLDYCHTYTLLYLVHFTRDILKEVVFRHIASNNGQT